MRLRVPDLQHVTHATVAEWCADIAVGSPILHRLLWRAFARSIDEHERLERSPLDPIQAGAAIPMYNGGKRKGVRIMAKWKLFHKHG